MIDDDTLRRELAGLRDLPFDAAKRVFGDGEALRRSVSSWLMPGFARIEPRDDGTWQPGGTVAAIVVPVWDWPPAALADLAAIDPEGDRVWLRRGLGDALGQHLLNMAEGPVTLTFEASPAAWLHSGGDGVCPIAETWLTQLLGRSDLTLVTADLAAGEALRRRLIAAMPALPKIGVRRVAPEGDVKAGKAA